MSLASNSTGFRLTGWHVLAMFVVFFGIDIAVNTVFIMRAYATYPGEVADNPYEDGLAYDSTIGRKEAQAKLGWRMTAGLVGASTVRITAVGPGAAPLSGLRFQGSLGRPATETGKRILAFHETAPGVYDAVTAPVTGAWDVKVTALDAKGHRFDAQRRLIGP
jgi:nitrogen fixation protein FixH